MARSVSFKGAGKVGGKTLTVGRGATTYRSKVSGGQTNYGVSNKHAGMAAAGLVVGGVAANKAYRHYRPKEGTHAKTGGLQSRQPVKTGGRVTTPYNQMQKANRGATTISMVTAGAVVGANRGAMRGRTGTGAAIGAVTGAVTGHTLGKAAYPYRKTKGGRL